MKRIQCMVTNETYDKVKAVLKACNDNWNDGVVRLQDVVDWLLAESKADIQKIRAQYVLPQKVIGHAKVESIEDLDEYLKKLNQLRPKLKSRKSV